MSSSFRAAAIFDAPPDLRSVDMYLSTIFNNQLEDNTLPIYSTIRLIATGCVILECLVIKYKLYTVTFQRKQERQDKT